jgi:hypothetical protein
MASIVLSHLQKESNKAEEEREGIVRQIIAEVPQAG